MNTAITRSQLRSIVERFFEDQGATVDFMLWDVDQSGVLEGVTVRHYGVVDLPPHEDD